MTLLGVLEDIEFFESRIPYTVDVMLTMDLGQPVDIAFNQRPDFYSDLDPATPSEFYDSDMDGQLTFTRLAYDQAAVVALIEPKSMDGESEGDGMLSAISQLFADHPFGMLFLMLLMLGSAIGAGFALNQRVRYDNVFLEEKEDAVAAELVLDADL